MNRIFSSKLFGSKQPPRRKELLRGDHKVIFEGTSHDSLVLFFNDSLILEGVTHNISGLGAIHQRMSEMLFTHLSDLGIHNHFHKSLNMREQLVQACEVIPFMLRIHTTVMEELASRFDLEVGTILRTPLVEMVTKGPKKNILSKDHLLAFDMADESEIHEIESLARRACDMLYGFFTAKGLRLTSIDLSFGRVYHDDPFDEVGIMLINELTPRTLHFVDAESGEDYSLTHAVKSGASIATIYQTLAERLGIIKLPQTETSKES